MAISPQTDIRLIKCPLTLSNKNQITFSNLQAQEQYFLSLPYIEDTNASYQRKDNVIRFNKHIDSIITYDYCMYKNENYSLQDRKFDKILTSKKTGIPIMLLFLGLIFWITISGANYPSQALSCFFGFLERKP